MNQARKVMNMSGFIHKVKHIDDPRNEITPICPGCDGVLPDGHLDYCPHCQRKLTRDREGGRNHGRTLCDIFSLNPFHRISDYWTDVMDKDDKEATDDLKAEMFTIK